MIINKIKFKSSDNRFSAEISNYILNNIKTICIDAKNKETGGILLGKYSKDRTNAIIVLITGPPKDSKSNCFTFKRGINGLNDIIHLKSKKGLRYIGEWHYHPNSNPKPSKPDDLQMKKFAMKKSLNCPEPILLIISGNENNWDMSVHVYTKNNKLRLNKF